MGRSGYSDGWDGWDGYPAELYYQAVRRALSGSRGQSFLKELASAMDAMTDKRLIKEALVTEEGDCCTMGVVCKVRNLDVSKVDETDPDMVGKLLNIAPSMAAEIAYENDERHIGETPEQRWLRMRQWVDQQLIKEAEAHV